MGFHDEFVGAVDADGGSGCVVCDGAGGRVRGPINGLCGGVDDAGFCLLGEGGDRGEDGGGGVEVYFCGEGGVLFTAYGHDAVEEEDGVPGGAEGEEVGDVGLGC